MSYRLSARLSAFLCTSVFLLSYAEAVFAKGVKEANVKRDAARIWQEIEQWREEWESGYNAEDSEELPFGSAQGREDSGDFDDRGIEGEWVDQWTNGYNEEDPVDTTEALMEEEWGADWKNGYNNEEIVEDTVIEEEWMDQWENGYNGEENAEGVAEESDDVEDSRDLTDAVIPEGRPTAPVRPTRTSQDGAAVRDAAPSDAVQDDSSIPEPTWWQVPRATLPEEGATVFSSVESAAQVAVPAQGGGALFLEFSVPHEEEEPAERLDEADYEENTDPETQIS